MYYINNWNNLRFYIFDLSIRKITFAGIFISLHIMALDVFFQPASQAAGTMKKNKIKFIKMLYGWTKCTCGSQPTVEHNSVE